MEIIHLQNKHSISLAGVVIGQQLGEIMIMMVIWIFF